MIRVIILNHIPFFDASQHKKRGQPIKSTSPGFFFARSIFILPMCQNRHTSSSHGHFLFYRRVGTVTRHHLAKERSSSFIFSIRKKTFLIKSKYNKFKNENYNYTYMDRLIRSKIWQYWEKCVMLIVLNNLSDCDRRD